jgi:hypothetical protein
LYIAGSSSSRKRREQQENKQEREWIGTQTDSKSGGDDDEAS